MNKMTKNSIYLKKRINDIEFIMLREEKKCWIKIMPIKQKSKHSIIYINLNNEEHQWDIYDITCKDNYKIYFKGYQIEPCFCLKSGEMKYKISFKNDDIKIQNILKKHDIKNFIRKNCNFISSNASCWAVAIYMTSRREKKPFSEM
jgi:hypothetical protein